MLAVAKHRPRHDANAGERHPDVPGSARSFEPFKHALAKISLRGLIACEVPERFDLHQRSRLFARIPRRRL
jgi:hypothetical protein